MFFCRVIGLASPAGVTSRLLSVGLERGRGRGPEASSKGLDLPDTLAIFDWLMGKR